MAGYYSFYASFIEQYIEFKRSMGYKFNDIYAFSLFDHFVIESQVDRIGLTRELVVKWSEKRLNESDKTRYKRIHYIANFSAFLNDIGYPSYIPKLPKIYKSTFTPYIFSKKELDDFFRTCDNLHVSQKSEIAHVLPAMFRMMYGCGLRISEAVSLKSKDVNLDEKYIIVRETKNGKDRMLPLSDSLASICTQYRNSHLRSHAPDRYFFSKKNGNKCNPKAVYEWFRKILWEAGISHGGRGLGPRMHDIRHSFSVHSLVAMSEMGLDLYYSLPILSKYLGHQSLEATDKYVRLTSEMYPDLIRDVDNICSYVFPEVMSHDPK